jgi:hypothetical protein
MKLAINKRPRAEITSQRAVIYIYIYIYSFIIGKGKAIPLQASTVPVGSRRLRLPDFKKIGT